MHNNYDDLFEDDIIDFEQEDEDTDIVKHIIMQLRGAVDVYGNCPIHFKDGSKQKFSYEEITAFLKKYDALKPLEKEKMQNMASQSPEGFSNALYRFTGEFKPKDHLEYDSDTRSRTGGLTLYS